MEADGKSGSKPLKVIAVLFWECRGCNEHVERGKSCPNCGRRLLED